MIHARNDYNRIQDPENLIGEDEPVFLLRAKDLTAPAIVRQWAAAQRMNPKTDGRIIKKAENWANVMETWQLLNATKVKFADL